MTEKSSALKLNFRCPTCSKLYEADPSVIKSSSPHFDCLVCGDTFTFDFPPKNFSQVATRSLQTKEKFPQAQKLEKECPKCHALNLKSAIECYSCQIVFKNFDQLRHETQPGAYPSLVQLWQEYLHEYENFHKREAFLKACENLKQWDYAETKLRELHRVLGQDKEIETALSSLQEKKTRAQEILSSPKFEKMNRPTELSQESVLVFLKSLKALVKSRWAEKPPFFSVKRALFLGPVVLSALMILSGLFLFPHHNMVGPGVAILILHLGLVITIRGRLSISDFLQK